MNNLALAIILAAKFNRSVFNHDDSALDRKQWLAYERHFGSALAPCPYADCVSLRNHAGSHSFGGK